MRAWFGDDWHVGPALSVAEIEDATTTSPSEPPAAPPPTADTTSSETEEASTVTKKERSGRRAAVLHCKAGKGRSGTTASAYLVAARGWPAGAALARFTARRMRPGWGAEGISIRSQRRWVAYAERWARAGGRRYDAGLRVRVTEVRAWGVRENVSVRVRGFVEGGRRVAVLARWGEGEVVPVPDEEEQAREPLESMPLEDGVVAKPWLAQQWQQWQQGGQAAANSADGSPRSSTSNLLLSNPAPRNVVVLRPLSSSPLIALGTPDVNVEVERRSSSMSSRPLVTSTAHSWFNVFFEAGAPENGGVPARMSGAYEVGWEGMDGLKGSSQRGWRAVERVAVFWEIVPAGEGEEELGGRQEEEVVEEEEEKKVAIEDDRSEEGVRSYGVKAEEV